jgi:hypothetical protein
VSVTPPPRSAARKRARWLAIGAVASVTAVAGFVVVRRTRRVRSVPALAPAPSVIPALVPPPVAVPEPARVVPAVVTGRQVWAACAAVVALAAGAGAIAAAVDRPAGSPAAQITATGALPVPSWVPPPFPPVMQPAYTPPPSPARVGGILPSDVPVVMRGGSGEEMLLTLAIVRDPAPFTDPDLPDAPALTPPALGRRLVSVTVRVENLGGVPFLDDLEKYTWLIDADNRFYGRSIEMTDARQFRPAGRLDPRSLTVRTVVFEVDGDARLIRFRLSLQPGVPERTQDWYLI